MNRKALRKDFYMEILKSLGRFLSIFFIVALGVAFFSGIRAAEPDLRATADVFFDKRNLMDIKVISTMGLSAEDLEAVRSVDGVKAAEGGYSTDVLCNIEESQKVLHVISMQSKMNQVDVAEGRLPKTQGECFVDIDFMNTYGFQIGDSITVESGNDKAITETLKQDTYEIVGAGSSPFYISFQRGSSTIGTGDVNGFLYVPEEAFALDVFTELYASVEEAKELTAYTEAYDHKVDSVIANIEGISGVRCIARRESIVAEATVELEEAKIELEDGKREAEEKLAEAAVTIADGERQLEEAKDTITSGKKSIADAKRMFETKQAELNQGRKEYESGLKQLKDGKAELARQEATYQDGKAQADKEFAQAQAALHEARATLDAGLAKYQEGMQGVNQLEEAIAGLHVQLEQLQQTPEETPGREEGILELQQQIQMLTGQKEQAMAVLESSKAELDAGEAQYQTQQNAFEQAKADTYAKLEAGRQALEDGKAKLTESEKQLNQAYSTIKSGETQLDDGKAELLAKEKELIEAENLIPQKEQELADGKKEYEENKAKAETDIKEGEAKIADAEQEIAEIEKPKWYVDNREVLPEHAGFGDNADRIRAIGEVFPFLFFLVAALISLTTMTRMVEEQRTQIGTLKALGYSKLSIAGKYLGYAFLATLGGSVFGVLVGEKILPYIIITAYKIMYQHIPNVEIPYNLEYAFMASGTAIACTMVATILSCYHELSDQPAVLMRPPAPKQGKRVLIERVTWFWKHLSFTWKSTIRNLIRYKKRFFMTIFGIGGCMALMIVGFGLKDSITDIARIQYQELQSYEGTAYLKDNYKEEDRTSLIDSLKEEKKIKDFTQAYLKKIDISRKKERREVYMMVPENADRFSEYITFRGRMKKDPISFGDEGAILTEKMAKMLDAEVGDTVELMLNERKVPVKVSGVTEQYMGHYIYLSPALYQKIADKTMQPNSILLKTPDLSEKELKKVGEKVLEQEAVLNVTYTTNLEGQVSDMLKALDQVIVVLIISAGMLAFVVLYNLNNINITERKRELATIKVLGFYDLEVAEYVYRENVLLTAIGVLVGLLMGTILHRYVIVTVEIDEVMFARVISMVSYALSILFTVGFSAFVNWVMYYKLRKIDMVESLKSIE